jgi:phosphatidylserine decarboxylase
MENGTNHVWHEPARMTVESPVIHPGKSQPALQSLDIASALIIRVIRVIRGSLFSISVTDKVAEYVVITIER